MVKCMKLSHGHKLRESERRESRQTDRQTDRQTLYGKYFAVGRWFPQGTPVSSTRKLISSSSFHRLDMTLAVAEALNPNKPIMVNIIQMGST